MKLIDIDSEISGLSLRREIAIIKELIHGRIFLKYGRKGAPKKRLVYSLFGYSL